MSETQIINEEPKQKGCIKTMKVKGRKSKLTPELIEKISAEIENGNDHEIYFEAYSYLLFKIENWEKDREFDR